MRPPLHARVSVPTEPSVLTGAADSIDAIIGVVLGAEAKGGDRNGSWFVLGDERVSVDHDGGRVAMRRTRRPSDPLNVLDLASPDLVVSTRTSEDDLALSGCPDRLAVALAVVAAACRDAAPTAILGEAAADPVRESTLRALALCAAVHLGIDRMVSCTPATPWGPARISLDGLPDAVEGFDRLVHRRVGPTLQVEAERDLLRVRVAIAPAPIPMGEVTPLEAMRAIRCRRPSIAELRPLRLRKRP